MTKRLTIPDEVSAGAWGEASMLIRHILEHPYDLSGFHKLESQVQASWMPQALASIAAHLLTDLAAKNSNEPGDVLTKAVYDVMTIQAKRNGT
jgi:hypothetical protein